MTTLYGSLRNNNMAERAEYVSDAFYDHPAYKGLVGARQKLELIQTLMDEVIGVIPETPTKSAAVLQLHTASMWLDKAIDQGHTALRKAFSQMEQHRKAQDAHNARAGDERADDHKFEEDRRYANAPDPNVGGPGYAVPGNGRRSSVKSKP